MTGRLDALRGGGKAELARFLSALEARPDDPDLLGVLDAAFAAPRGIVVGLTGPPGVGKSTLAGAFVTRLRRDGMTVAVVAVDPTSRRSGGALLGDRARIEADPADAGVFVRSMAARSRLGGLADLAYPAAVLMRALFDVVLVETVGVGQSETSIVDCADVVVLCLQPGAGDALQFMKAGVMEVPDLVLVTKGDLGAPAERTVADARGALSLAGGTDGPPSVALVSAASGAGVEAALASIRSTADARERAGALGERRYAQGRAWVEARLVESFGTVGFAALAPRIDGRSGQFGAFGGLAAAARRAVHECLKRV